MEKSNIYIYIYIYIDSLYKTSDSVSNSDFKFEIKEGVDLPGNTICYIDDIM